MSEYSIKKRKEILKRDGRDLMMKRRKLDDEIDEIVQELKKLEKEPDE